MEFTVQAVLAGIHPRSEDLVQATRDADRGRADASHLEAVRARDAQALVDLQAKAGFIHVGDGQLGFQDLFRPFAERAQGLAVGALTRWFDNNTFFRQPVVQGPLKHTGPVVQPALVAVRIPQGHQRHVALPGPYTFARHAEDLHYGSREKLVGAFAREVLAPEVRALAKSGVGWIQFSEPSLVWDRPKPEEWEALHKAYLAVLDGVKVTSSVATFFGDSSRLLTELFDLPVDYVGVDLTETPVDAFDGFQPTRGVQLGIVDARSSIVERPQDIVATAEDLLSLADVPALALAPSADLEFLPRALADEKVVALGQAAATLNKGGA